MLMIRSKGGVFINGKLSSDKYGEFDCSFTRKAVDVPLVFSAKEILADVIRLFEGLRCSRALY